MIHDRSAERPTNKKIINPGAPACVEPRRAAYIVNRCERGYTGPNICIRGINVIIGIVGQIYDNDGRWFDVSRTRLLARGSAPYMPVNIAWYCSRRRLPPLLAKEAFENSYRRYPDLRISPVFIECHSAAVPVVLQINFLERPSAYTVITSCFSRGDSDILILSGG